MKIPILYNIRSVLRRPATSLATALGVAFVVLTFVGMLALANGFRAALVSTGRPDNVFLLRKGADAGSRAGSAASTPPSSAASPRSLGSRTAGP